MKKINFNRDWQFALENSLDAFNGFGFEKYSDASGAPARFYDYSNWEKVDLPHDWAVGLEKDIRANTFAGARANTAFHRFMTERRSEVEETFSVGWYRKQFLPDAAWQGKRVFIEFEGVFRDAVCWVNGVYLDRHTSGYTSFLMEITDHLVFGEENSVAVLVDSDQPEGWWYEGAGIYRNVFLHVAEPVYVRPRKTAIRTGLDGQVNVQCLLMNDTDEEFDRIVQLEIVDAAGGKAASAAQEIHVSSYSEALVEANLHIESPRLWHVDHPYLYSLNIRIGEEVHTEAFGVRTVGFDADKGFMLNNAPLKIRGACVHQDFGGVGVALQDNLQYYKIKRLKEMGVNAYRCSHHAPAPALLRACDELGMLVMDETRMFGTSPEAVRQLTDIIERDRNHPCVFIWCLGNEEFSVQDIAWSRRLMEKMTRIAKQLDSTRPVTYGGNNGPNFVGANSAAEIRGVNYIRNDGGQGGLWLEQYHEAHPAQPIIGTEESSYVLSRGGQANDLGSGKLDCSGLVTMPWGSTPKGWVKYFEQRDYLAGSFMWTGFDYRGEPNPFVSANISSSFGTIDLCGIEKPPFYYYKAWWTDEPVLEIAPHWNWRPGETADIFVFTNCGEISLYVNGKQVETRTVERFDAPVFRVPFEEGVLSVEGRKDESILRRELHTSGQASYIRCVQTLRAENDQEAGIYRLDALDENNIFCPDAMDRIEVSVENGEIIAVGNGDPADMEREQAEKAEEAVSIRVFSDGKSLYTVPPKEKNRLQLRYDWLEMEQAGEVNFGLTDWTCPSPEPDDPLKLINSALRIKFLRITALAEKLAGNAAAEERVRAEIEKRIADYKARHLTADGTCIPDNMCSAAMTIYNGLYDDLEPLKKQLMRHIEERNFHHNCGMVGLRRLYMALNRCGLQEYAYRIITAEGRPCYREWLEGDATTLWEVWDESSSKNHHMYSDFMSWLMKTPGGIDHAENAPGFTRVRIAPYFLESLDYCRASQTTVRGEVSVHWQRTEAGVQLTFRVPEGMTAEYEGKDYAAGEYEFII